MTSILINKSSEEIRQIIKDNFKIREKGVETTLYVGRTPLRIRIVYLSPNSTSIDYDASNRVYIFMILLLLFCSPLFILLGIVFCVAKACFKRELIKVLSRYNIKCNK